MNKKVIYLDNAATTQTDEKVLKAMLPYFSKKYGNPMAIYSLGQEAREAIESAREKVAKFLNCAPTEIIFTSGATESNNLALKGVIEFWKKNNPGKIPHIIISAFEHHCIYEPCKAFEKSGMAEITYLPVYKDGIVKAEDVKKAIKSNTILVSVMYVNNEIGTVQPIAEIGKAIKSVNDKILFHTDATQAINYFDCDVQKLKVDLLSMSAHKVYGPKGIGVLYSRKNIPIKRIQEGGEQEFGLRAGTHNVPAIVGLGKAVELISNNKVREVLKLRNYLIQKVLKEIPGSYLNGSKEKRSPNNANFRFDNVEGESLVLALDIEGVCASTGSACSSGTLEPSHVLLALGLKHEQAHGSLRLTLSKHTTKKEINETVKILKDVVKRLREISGKVLKEYYNNK
jgi:cysteine desulfurase